MAATSEGEFQSTWSKGESYPKVQSILEWKIFRLKSFGR
jgi:hypothetical protein